MRSQRTTGAVGWMSAAPFASKLTGQWQRPAERVLRGESCCSAAALQQPAQPLDEPAGPPSLRSPYAYHASCVAAGPKRGRSFPQTFALPNVFLQPATWLGSRALLVYPGGRALALALGATLLPIVPIKARQPPQHRRAQRP